MSITVVLKPIPTKGRTQYGVFPNAHIEWGIGLNSRTGEKVTGLSLEDEKELEEKLQLKPGELSKSSPYWNSFKVVLTNKEEELNLDNPVDKLKYLVLLTKKQVAKDRNAIRPDSVFLMYNEVEEAEKENLKTDILLTAYGYLHEMSDEQKADFLKLFGGVKTWSLKPSVIKKKLVDFANADPKLFVSVYEDKDKNYKIMFEDLIQKRIVKVKNGAYYHGEDMLGADLNLAIEKVKNPKNQDLLIVLKKKMEETPFS